MLSFAIIFNFGTHKIYNQYYAMTVSNICKYYKILHSQGTYRYILERTWTLFIVTIGLGPFHYIHIDIDFLHIYWFLEYAFIYGCYLK